MKYYLLVISVVAAMCTSCNFSTRDTTLYQQSGRQKAIVAVLPVINQLQSDDLSWDLSQEFTDEIRQHVYVSPTLYLLRNQGSLEVAQALSAPLLSDIPRATVRSLGAAEFVVVAELIEQNESKYGLDSVSERRVLKNDAGAVLDLAMRLRVLDMRGDTPKIILQEILNNKHVVARAYMNNDYSKTPWGTEAFQCTPLGLAHSRMVREIVARVESYIEASR